MSHEHQEQPQFSLPSWQKLYESLGVIADVAEYAHEQEQLATRDQMTGTLNRRGFEPVFKNAQDGLARRLYQEKKTGQPANPNALLAFDLDNLHGLNEKLGHNGADLLIIELARTITDRIRPTDYVVRLGGDEFGALVTDVDEDEAQTIADDIVRLYRHATANEGASISVGFTLTSEKDDIKSTVKRADEAMYEAKNKGKDKAVSYTKLKQVKAKS